MAQIYAVTIERDESGAWIAEVPAVPGCHTYGKSIDQTLRRTREALGLWVNDADFAVLEPDIKVSAEIRRTAETGRRARERAERAHDSGQRALATAARSLTESGLSRRDAATLLGISHQRVQQLVRDG